MAATTMFDVGVLLYGEYPLLAERCLQALLTGADWSLLASLRVGLNAVGDETRRVLDRLLPRFQTQVITAEEATGRNVGKYPLMRRLLAGTSGSHWIWFDDDSFLTRPAPAWWQALAEVVKQGVLLGSPYRPRRAFTTVQQAAIGAQPWFRGKPVSRDHRVLFCTGGWWVMELAKLKAFDYPFPALRHNGGDVILGELCRQQDWKIVKYREGVAINADALGRESMAARRGLTTAGPWDGPGSLEHQQFECTLRVIREA